MTFTLNFSKIIKKKLFCFQFRFNYRIIFLLWQILKKINFETLHIFEIIIFKSISY